MSEVDCCTGSDTTSSSGIPTFESQNSNVVQGILYSEFNVTRGPEIVLQSPPDFFPKEDFGILEKYLITKPELSGKIITIRVHNYQVVSAPVHITGACYPRNYLLFNIAFVFDCETDTSIFEPIVRKLAGVLQTLEINSGYIVSAEKNLLQDIFDSILQSLNVNGKCEVPVNASTIIRLEVTQASEIFAEVGAHEVPIPLCDLQKIGTENLDWAIIELIPFIDGDTFAKAIATKSGIDLHIVLLALRALATKKLIALVPLFQFHSIYLVTRRVVRLLHDKDLMHRAVEFTKVGPGRAQQDASKLFELYCDLTPRHPYWTVADFNESHSLLKLGIDVRRFVYFGVLEGILFKLDRRPFRDVSGKETFGHDPPIDDVNYVPANMLKGWHTTDEICCAMEIGARHLAEVCLVASMHVLRSGKRVLWQVCILAAVSENVQDARLVLCEIKYIQCVHGVFSMYILCLFVFIYV
eukprot:m.384731 g.384731  ORF g.384731 m.384731 type:complete len:468 (-) comp20999_c0_seq3:1002-2405(-)